MNANSWLHSKKPIQFAYFWFHPSTPTENTFSPFKNSFISIEHKWFSRKKCIQEENYSWKSWPKRIEISLLTIRVVQYIIRFSPQFFEYCPSHKYHQLSEHPSEISFVSFCISSIFSTTFFLFSFSFFFSPHHYDGREGRSLFWFSLFSLQFSKSYIHYLYYLVSWWKLRFWFLLSPFFLSWSYICQLNLSTIQRELLYTCSNWTFRLLLNLGSGGQTVY